MGILNTLFKNKEDMSQEEVYTKFIKLYHKKLEDNKNSNNKMGLTEIPEFTDDNLNELVNIYLTSSTLDEAMIISESILNQLFQIVIMIGNLKIMKTLLNLRNTNMHKMFAFTFMMFQGLLTLKKSG